MANYAPKRTRTETYRDLTESASKAFSSSSYQRNGDTPTFEHFRSVARATRKVWVDEKKVVDAKIKEISDTYLAGKAVPMITEIRNDYAIRRAGAVQKLQNVLASTCREKRAALDMYMMRPPTSDVLNLLTAYNLRTSEVSERELNALLARCGSNYQSLQICHDICDRYGFDFKMPIDCDEFLHDVDMIEELAGKMVNDNIDKEELPYSASLFFNYDDDCMLTSGNVGYSLAENDTTTASLTGVVPTTADSLKAVIELKKAEVKLAKENDDLPAAKKAGKDLNEVANFYNKNKNDLMTEEERREAIENEAADLLDGIMD